MNYRIDGRGCLNCMQAVLQKWLRLSCWSKITGGATRHVCEFACIEIMLVRLLNTSQTLLLLGKEDDQRAKQQGIVELPSITKIQNCIIFCYRQHRLSQLRSRAAQRRNDESGSQREERLSHLRDAAAVRRSDDRQPEGGEALEHEE